MRDRAITRTLLATALAMLAALPAHALETQARAAWVYDMTTGSVLLEKDADLALPPASMSKLMTLLMLFEALRDGRVTMDTEFTVSSRAKAMGGSTMYLDERDRPTVRDLIQGIIVNSGNDACVVVAEGLAGSEDAFARLATQRAHALGMVNTTLTNASGWPDAGHRMSVRDLGILARHLIEDFPEHYSHFSETEFDYKNRAPANSRNRNPLLALNVGADGLKTGHTQEAGYGLVGSAMQGDRRVIFVITGLERDVDRAQESERIVNWAFRQFSLRTVAPEGARVADAPVWMGEAETVGLVAAREVKVLVPSLQSDAVQARVDWQGPLQAPLAAGQQVGELVVTVPDMPEVRVPVLVQADVPPAGFLRRVGTAARVLAGRATSMLAF
ncbi:D-alanyl-D-alanine carboxypeptidase family protein [Gemmobacter sp.]|uniref:D-alanyl-D-alanine carboxypeptidase family protein n=1 Tax=Gemmobacter sp. TaxID=1898957 RepID=UPI002AFFBA72|nr:D-alanyl-D-alanine carboxypeptidase family protein [Gemmobacter sp.]